MGKMNKNQFKGQLDPALDKLIKRKVEDFELGYMEGKDMNATTQNTVNIINSQISNAVVQITQSGKDAISKDTALKLKELINSEAGDPTRMSPLAMELVERKVDVKLIPQRSDARRQG